MTYSNPCPILINMRGKKLSKHETQHMRTKTMSYESEIDNQSGKPALVTFSKKLQDLEFKGWTDLEVDENLVAEIKQRGHIGSTLPMVKKVNGLYRVVRGHDMVKAAQEAGLKEIWVMIK